MQQQTLEWTFLHTCKVIKKSYRLIFAIAVAAAIITAIVSLFFPNVYRAAAVFVVKESKIQAEAVSLKEAEVKLYESIVKNKNVLLRLRDKFALDPAEYKLRALESMVTARIQKGTSQIEMFVDFEDPTKACEMAQFLADEAVIMNASLETTEGTSAEALLTNRRKQAEARMIDSASKLHEFKTTSKMHVLDARMNVALNKAVNLEERIRYINVNLAILGANRIPEATSDVSLSSRSLGGRLVSAREELAKFKSESQLGAKQEELTALLKEIIDLETRIRQIERRMSIQAASTAGIRMNTAREQLSTHETLSNLTALSQDVDTWLKIVSEQETERSRVETQIASERVKLATIEYELGERLPIRITSQSILRKPEMGMVVPNDDKKFSLTVESEELDPRFQLLESEQSRAIISLAAAEAKLKDLNEKIKKNKIHLDELNKKFTNDNTRKTELDLELELVQEEYVSVQQTSLQSYQSEWEETKRILKETRVKYDNLYKEYLEKNNRQQELELDLSLTEGEYKGMFIDAVATLETEQRIALSEKNRILGEYDKLFDEYTRRSLELGRLESEYTQRQKTFETIVARLDEVLLTVSTKSKELIVIDKPVVPDRKIGPRRSLFVLISFVLVLVLASFGVLGKEYMSLPERA